jgi:hypothetical protein
VRPPSASMSVPSTNCNSIGPRASGPLSTLPSTGALLLLRAAHALS